MLAFEELNLKLLDIKPTLDDLAEALGLSALKIELADLEEKAAVETFWEDMENSQKVLQRTSQIKNILSEYQELYQDYEDTLTLIELANDAGDTSLLGETTEGVNRVIADVERIKLTTLLSGEYDAKNAILTFHAGAGGTEAQDWALMLYRMYCRWADRHKCKTTVLDMLDGDEAGIKSASILIEGKNAYGFLKSESGVHRLVRISPFDSSGRRHTSFASLEVMPEIDESITIDIKDEDLRVDTYRASGAGGQHINKTESAIRITHLPTGVVVACQTQRSQHQNRDYAMKMLKSKLIEIKEREHLDHIEDIKGVQKEIAWGSQIRSYVFMPYTMAKDHRTGYEVGNINAVMDGELDGLINAYLKAASLGTLGK